MEIFLKIYFTYFKGKIGKNYKFKEGLISQKKVHL